MDVNKILSEVNWQFTCKLLIPMHYWWEAFNEHTILPWPSLFESIQQIHNINVLELDGYSPQVEVPSLPVKNDVCFIKHEYSEALAFLQP